MIVRFMPERWTGLVISLTGLLLFVSAIVIPQVRGPVLVIIAGLVPAVPIGRLVLGDLVESGVVRTLAALPIGLTISLLSILAFSSVGVEASGIAAVAGVGAATAISVVADIAWSRRRGRRFAPPNLASTRADIAGWLRRSPIGLIAAAMLMGFSVGLLVIPTSAIAPELRLELQLVASSSRGDTVVVTNPADASISAHLVIRGPLGTELTSSRVIEPNGTMTHVFAPSLAEGVGTPYSIELWAGGPDPAAVVWPAGGHAR